MYRIYLLMREEINSSFNCAYVNFAFPKNCSFFKTETKAKFYQNIYFITYLASHSALKINNMFLKNLSFS